MGYDGIYIYMIYVCDTVGGCQILHQLRDVVKSPWVSTCFNMFQPSKGGARFRKNPQLSTVHFSKQWLSGFSTQQCFLGLGLLPLYPQCKRWTKSTMISMGKSIAQRLGPSDQTWVHFPGYTADLHRNTTGWNLHDFYPKRLENNVFSEKKNKIIARPPGKRLTMENQHVFHGKIH
jgi:hypothetical protein